GPGIRVGGRYRRRHLRDFDVDAYHQRSKVETVFSVEKRKMGSHVLARDTSQQHKELIFRAFSYNSVRMETPFLLSIEVFYKAADVELNPVESTARCNILSLASTRYSRRRRSSRLVSALLENFCSVVQ
ncbi:MAG TPA: transposase, partial [Thermoplasmata archaeon]